jgi:hypothetical protein
MVDSPLHPDEAALVRCATSKGPVVMEFHRDWSPNGYDRAVSLFEKGEGIEAVSVHDMAYVLDPELLTIALVRLLRPQSLFPRR